MKSTYNRQNEKKCLKEQTNVNCDCTNLFMIISRETGYSLGLAVRDVSNGVSNYWVINK